MGRAGTALKTVLGQYGISQGRLADALQIGSSNVYRWCNEIRDPTAETVVAIVGALQTFDPEAARDFVQRYLGELVETRDRGEQPTEQVSQALQAKCSNLDGDEIAKS